MCDTALHGTTNMSKSPHSSTCIETLDMDVFPLIAARLPDDGTSDVRIDREAAAVTLRNFLNSSKQTRKSSLRCGLFEECLGSICEGDWTKAVNLAISCNYPLPAIRACYDNARRLDPTFAFDHNDLNETVERCALCTIKYVFSSLSEKTRDKIIDCDDCSNLSIVLVHSVIRRDVHDTDPEVFRTMMSFLEVVEKPQFIPLVRGLQDFGTPT